jgi:hypothetical protein
VNLLARNRRRAPNNIASLGTTKKAILFRYEDETLYTSAGEFKTALISLRLFRQGGHPCA